MDRRSDNAGSATETVVISRRELARELRRKAYRDAKARRAKDPRFLAMKEAAKQRRRELYQLAKEKKKAAAAGAGEGASLRRGKAEGVRDRTLKESSSKASTRAAIASALGALRRAKEQSEGQPDASSELIDSLRSSGEREGAANDRT